MTPATLDSLITARALLNDARRLALAGDRHFCTAALIQLQDALELIFLALLRECSVDEKNNLESMSFDQMIGALKKLGVTVPRSGTLKALNKQRVICKHYGQLAEPATVQQYLAVSELAIDSLLPEVLGKPLDEIFLTDLIAEGAAKVFLEQAASLIRDGNYLQALVSIRKAIFVEVEVDYSVHEYRDGAEPRGGLGLLLLREDGRKAPYWTKNAEWIKDNVKCPTDFIQIDYEKLRFDAIEWGVHTEELQNIRRLTPEVFRYKKDGEWHIQFDLNFPKNQANKENCNYCLDRSIDVILRKQMHEGARRWPNRDQPFDPPPVYLGDSLYAKAAQDAEVVHTVADEFRYTFHKAVSGFDPQEKYYYLSGYKADPNNPLDGEYVSGFLLVREAEP